MRRVPFDVHVRDSSPVSVIVRLGRSLFLPPISDPLLRLRRPPWVPHATRQPSPHSLLTLLNSRVVATPTRGDNSHNPVVILVISVSVFSPAG